MAYPLNGKQLTLANAANQILLAPKNEIGDYLIISMDRYATVTINDVGYTEISSSGWNIYYKKVTSEITTIDITANSNDRDRVFAFVVRGCHQTDPLDGLNPLTHIAGVSGNGQTITTNTDNALIVTFAFNISGSDMALFECPYEPLWANTKESYASHSLAFTYQAVAGVTPVPFLPACLNASFQSITLAFRDDGNNNQIGYQDPSAPLSTEHLSAYRNEGETQWASEILIPSVNNGTFNALTDGTKSNALSSSYPLGTHSYPSSPLNTGSTNLIGKVLAGGFSFNSVKNLDGKILTCIAKYEKTGDFQTELGQLIGLSDGTNTRIWQIAGEGALPDRGKGEYPYVFETDAGFHLEDQGTVNSATLGNSAHLFIGHYVVATNMEMSWGIVRIVGTLPMIGGTVAKPISFKDAFRIAQQTDSNLIQSQNEQVQGQYLFFQKLQVGGSAPTYFKAFGESSVWANAYDKVNNRPQCAVSSGKFGLTINLMDGDTYDVSGIPLNFGNFHTFEIHATTSKHATTTYNFNGNVNQFCTPILNNVGVAVKGLVISNSKEITYTDLLDMSNGCEVSKCVDAQAITVTSEVDFNKLHNCVFDNCSNVAIKITGDQTHTGAGWSDPNISFNGNVFDIEYTGSTDFSIQSTLAISVLNSGVGTLIAVTPTVDTGFNFTGLESGSQVVFFENGTTTEIQRNNATTNNEIWSELYVADRLIDYTIMKVGFDPIRVVGVTAGNTVQTIAIQQKVSRAYQSGTGFTYITDGAYNTSTNIFTINKPMTVQEYYSCMIDAWIAQASLVNSRFPITPNGSNSFSFDDATINLADIVYLYRDGMRFRTGTTIDKKWSAIWSSGNVGTEIAEIQQASGATPIKGWNAPNQTNNGNIDMLLQVYENGVLDYQNYLVIEYAKEGKYQGRVVAHEIYPVIEDDLYVVAVESTDSPITPSDPVLANPPTIILEATPVLWNGKNFSITIKDSVQGNTGTQIAQWVNWNIRESNDTAFQGQDPMNWYDMIIDNATSWETSKGTVLGQFSDVAVGVRVINDDGSAHIDFTRHQSNDSTYYVKPVTANMSITNLTNIGTQYLWIYNKTTLLDVYSGDPNVTNYSNSYTNGVGISSGDSIQVRFVEVDSGISFKKFDTVVTATVDGFSIDASNFIASDAVYAANGIDGSTITKFSADFVGAEINLVANVNFTAPEAYAFYCNSHVSALGIEAFWNGVIATDVANYKIITGVLSLLFDNQTTGSKRQTDSARIYRDDGLYPVKDPTTSGYGIDVNWQNVVYVQNIGGSTLTAGEQAQLGQIASSTTALTFTKTNELDVNVKSFVDVTQQGDGTEVDPFRSEGVTP